MAQICEHCGKKPTSGHNVSYSNRKTKRRFLPNLVSKKIWNVAEKMFEQWRICTRCLRTLAKKL